MNNLQPLDIAIMGYLSALNEWGISPAQAPFQACGCVELTWDKFYDVVNNTNKIWGISYHQE